MYDIYLNPKKCLFTISEGNVVGHIVSKEGVRARVWMHNHRSKYSENHSYKLNFQCTNNIAEYEALMLGLKLLNKVGAK